MTDQRRDQRGRFAQGAPLDSLTVNALHGSRRKHDQLIQHLGHAGTPAPTHHLELETATQARMTAEGRLRAAKAALADAQANYPTK